MAARPRQMTMARFLYLFQVEHELPPSLEAACGPDSEIRFLSWRARSSDSRGLFYPSSSWTQGRNRLLKAVEGGNFEYVIFGDDDIVLDHTPPTPGRRDNPWRTFEQFLLEYEPAVGCPSYDWHLTGGAWAPHQECQTLRFFDAILNAFHRDAVPALLPYYDLLDEDSETYSQNLLCSLAADLYPGHVLQTNRLRVVNAQARREYGEFLLARPEHLYLEALRDPERRRLFRRQTVAGAARHPTMGPIRAKAGSYLRTEADLARLYDLAHPLWTRRREVRQLPESDAFFSDNPDSKRAQRWRTHRRPRVAPPVESRLRRLLRAAGLGPAARWGRRVLRGGRPVLPTHLFHEARRRRSAWRAHRLWREWWRTPGLTFEVPESRQDETLTLLAAALNVTAADPCVFVDVGAGQGDMLPRLVRSGLRRPLCAIGIDPVDIRGHRAYTGFVTAAISNEAEGVAAFHQHTVSACSSLLVMDPAAVTHDQPASSGDRYYSPALIEQMDAIIQVPTFRLATILQQYGLADGTLHYLKIDAQGSDLDVFRSLGSLRDRCLFLRMESVLPDAGGRTTRLYHGQSTFEEDRMEVESAGFRLLNIARFGVTPEADVTYVNTQLFEQLCAPLTR